MVTLLAHRAPGAAAAAAASLAPAPKQRTALTGSTGNE